MMKRLIVLSVALAAAAGCQSADPKTAESPDAEQRAEHQDIVDRAADAMRRMRGNPEFRAMNSYLESARAVAVFPNVVKAGFILGGSGGNGVVSARMQNGQWSAPAFYTFAAGSAGLQLGYQELSLVMFLMTDNAVRDLLDGDLKPGTSGTVNAGNKAADTRTTSSADLIYFADASGLFAGISLNGTVINPRDEYNREYYGENATPTAILMEGRFDRPGTDGWKQALSLDARVSRAEQRP